MRNTPKNLRKEANHTTDLANTQALNPRAACLISHIQEQVKAGSSPAAIFAQLKANNQVDIHISARGLMAMILMMSIMVVPVAQAQTATPDVSLESVEAHCVFSDVGNNPVPEEWRASVRSQLVDVFKDNFTYESGSRSIIDTKRDKFLKQALFLEDLNIELRDRNNKAALNKNLMGNLVERYKLFTQLKAEVEQATRIANGMLSSDGEINLEAVELTEADIKIMNWRRAEGLTDVMFEQSGITCNDALWVEILGEKPKGESPALEWTTPQTNTNGIQVSKQQADDLNLDIIRMLESFEEKIIQIGKAYKKYDKEDDLEAENTEGIYIIRHGRNTDN
ncbi:hypothetical protein KKF04_05535 [Patescibacteria group bacterium]|nr:hypothetical protein [Patescibacteria group bacterium]MBU1935491.1 hypothetical protein [Patescibacteria group bacterium]